jgi:hypothetical protein
MNINDLRPASDFARNFGVKCVVYGPPGTGKTPIFNTAPRPILCATEPGLLSMRNSNVPTFLALTAPAIEDFFAWFMTSNESKNFDTVGIDSGSQLAEILLEDERPKHRDGRKLYGALILRAMKYFEALYFMPQKHIYIICKETQDNGVKRPYFPGQGLNVLVPHRYDEILHCAFANVMFNGGIQTVKAFRTRDTIDIVARDRSGRLNEFEQCNLAALFAKAMS